MNITQFDDYFSGNSFIAVTHRNIAIVEEFRRYVGLNIKSFSPVTESDLFVCGDQIINNIINYCKSQSYDSYIGSQLWAICANIIITDLRKMPNHLSNRSRKEQGWVRNHQGRSVMGRAGSMTWWTPPVYQVDSDFKVDMSQRDALRKQSLELLKLCVILGEQQHFCGGRLIEYLRAKIIHRGQDTINDTLPPREIIVRKEGFFAKIMIYFIWSSKS